MAFKDFTVHLLQVLVHVRAVGIEAAAVAVVLGEVGGLGDQVDHIQAEAAHAFVAPEAHHLEHFGAHLGVVPIEVGLCMVEQMQVVLASLRFVLPGRAAELGFPVVRLVAPDVEVTIGIVEAAARLLEPFVFDGGVVDHDIEHQLDATLGGFADQQVAVGHSAVAGVDGVVVADVVAVVALGRTQERGDPQAIHAQPFEVVEFVHDAQQVTGGVTRVAVEAFGVDLVDHRVLPGLHGGFLQ